MDKYKAQIGGVRFFSTLFQAYLRYVVMIRKIATMNKMKGFYGLHRFLGIVHEPR